uniref:Uncharacterized protein n=1 Tax=Romanomermis culicivorax TaxID=13658 RepID=A0A915LB20_ROMCU
MSSGVRNYLDRFKWLTCSFAMWT